MREIKFRAWNGKEMINDALELSRPGVTGGGITTAWKKGVEWLQYTGLKDKNGIEIYEGDILLSHIGPDYKGNPLYRTVEYIDFTDDYGIGSIGYRLQGHQLDEVVGNIYENPELLK